MQLIHLLTDTLTPTHTLCIYLTSHFALVSFLRAEAAHSLLKCLTLGEMAALHLGHLTCEAGVGLLPLVILSPAHLRRDVYDLQHTEVK